MAFSPERLNTALEQCIARIAPPARGLCVALSGGLDSSVLLAALAATRDAGLALPLRAIHVDHGLHADSATWAEHCVSLAASFSVPLALVLVNARPGRGESPEAVARDARYAAFAGRLATGEVLLTAHHADDQLETILLQWLRGGGLRAVAGMPALGRFGAGWHARPLLAFTRTELRAYAAREQIRWLEDPSNVDPRFDRNYLRLAVLPAIRERWPAAARTAGRVAAQAEEALEIEAGIAGADLASVAEGCTLSLTRLERLPPIRQRWVLRAWLRALRLPVPAAATLAALQNDMSVAASDRVPCANWPGARVYRYRGRLYGVAEASLASTVPEGEWSPGSSFDMGDLGRLELRPGFGTGLGRDRLPSTLAVSVRSDGERFRPAGSAHHRPLRKWLQEHGVLPWRRVQVPLLRAGGELVAVGDLAYGADFCARAGEPSWTIVWHDRPLLTESDAGEVKRDERED